MDIEKLALKLHPLERRVLPLLKSESRFEDIVKKSRLKEVEVMRALQWLQNKKIIELKEEKKELIILDKNGIKYKEKGLPEKLFLKEIEDKPLSLSKIQSKTKLDKNEISISLGILRRKAAIIIKKDKELVLSISPNGKRFLARESLEEKFLKNKFPMKIGSLKPEEKHAFEELDKRREIVKKETKKLKYAKLSKLGKKIIKLDIKTGNVIEALSPQLLKSKKWKKKRFRRFDVEINVPEIHGGRRHFTNDVVEYIKKIWLELGFVEMQGNLVQSSFWDLDALFVPQDHPAREMQDTFYINKPAKGSLPYKQTVNNIKATHENGWTTGSKGWKCRWSTAKAKENLLRTHTTALSAKTIANLKKEDLPAKFFAVGKVFRNETLDWKHLFEFYQVEGIVVDPDVNLKHLIGYLRGFFKKMGFPDVRVRPAHFPYTEPSAEVEVFDPVRKEWIEFGGSGIFRPEVTKPLMGFECPVLAWGLTLERSIQKYYNINDIRELYKNDIKQLREIKLWLK
ncbi:phenylalanine--tRNA ligase subunit alpha [Candidatus Woesearchaeota archaeon]|nr:phenylalanine--tRNA ligase subunit alpha [Candidatus Woesearchaeota archaeon]